MRSFPFFLRYRVVTAGGIVLAGLVVAMTGRAAPGPDIPTVPNNQNLVQPDPNSFGGSAGSAPQPIAIQALDPSHFVVVTREPRLVQRAGGDGRYVNMLLPVVTHYTVQNGRLTPIEHVHVPEGWRPLAVGP